MMPFVPAYRPLTPSSALVLVQEMLPRPRPDAPMRTAGRLAALMYAHPLLYLALGRRMLNDLVEAVAWVDEVRIALHATCGSDEALAAHLLSADDALGAHGTLAHGLRYISLLRWTLYDILRPEVCHRTLTGGAHPGGYEHGDGTLNYLLYVLAVEHPQRISYTTLAQRTVYPASYDCALLVPHGLVSAIVSFTQPLAHLVHTHGMYAIEDRLYDVGDLRVRNTFNQLADVSRQIENAFYVLAGLRQAYPQHFAADEQPV